MKTVIHRLLPMLLALLLLAGVLAGCSKTSSDDGKNTGATTTGSGGIINPGDDTGEEEVDPYYGKYEKDDLPDDLDFGNKTFTILCDAGQYGKSFADAYTGDTINSAIYARSERVQERLGIVFDIIRETGAYAGISSFTQKLVEGDGLYDLVLSYNLTPATMAIQGLVTDLKSTKYLNFEKPWWSGALLDNVSINDRVFFTGDNSSWNNLRNMLGVFVDKQVFLANHHDMTIDDLYDLVEDNEWTMEKMFELAKGVYKDDGDNVVTKDTDTFGLSTGNSVWMEAWFFAAGFVSLQQNDAGAWNFNIGDESVLNFVSWFQGKFYDSGTNDCVNYDSQQYKMFKEGRAQFYLSALSMVEQNLEQPFAVLPEPMYDAQRQNNKYSTHFSNTYDMYTIPVNAQNIEMSSAVLECLASEAYRRVAPAYFESYLKKRNSSDSRLQDMYDILRAGIVFDPGVLFGELFVKGDNPIYFVRRALNRYSDYGNLGAKWTSTTNEQYLALWEKNLEELNKLP